MRGSSFRNFAKTGNTKGLAPLGGRQFELPGAPHGDQAIGFLVSALLADGVGQREFQKIALRTAAAEPFMARHYGAQILFDPDPIPIRKGLKRGANRDNDFARRPCRFPGQASERVRVTRHAMSKSRMYIRKGKSCVREGGRRVGADFLPACRRHLESAEVRAVQERHGIRENI
jgi:hypothetical protein